MYRLTICLCFLLGVSAKVNGCGYYLLSESYRVALLNPYLVGDEYEAFFFSSDYLPDAPAHRKTGHDRQRNCAEWAQELGGAVRWSDVMELLYGSSYDDWLQDEPRPEWPLNAAWQALQQRPDLLEYILYAKAYEVPVSADKKAYSWNNIATGWTEYAAPGPRDDSDTFRKRAEQGFQAAPEGSFLRHRYAYQLLLLARYANDANRFYQYFDRYFRDGNDVLADWARHHEIYFLGDPVARFLSCARSFSRCPEKAISAVQQAKYQSRAPNLTSIPTSNRPDVIAFMALREQGYTLDQMSQLYRLQPNHPVLPLLIVREINKVENWLLTEPLTQQNPPMPSQELNYDAFPQTAFLNGGWRKLQDSLYRENARKDRAYISELRAFIDVLSPTRHSALDAPRLRIFRAQLAMLDNDPEAALRQLSPSLISAPGLVGIQATIIRYVALVQSAPLASPETQGALVDLLCELETHLPRDRQPHNVLPALQRMTAQAYASSGDTVTAFFFHQKSLELPYTYDYGSDYYQRIDYLDRQLSPSVFDGVLELLTKEGENDRILQYYQSAKLPSVNALHDVAGTVALRRNDLEEAHRHFSQIPDAWYPNSYAFGYFLNHSPFQSWFFSPRADESPYAKSKVTATLLALEKKAAAGGPDAAQAYYDLGNAWYNMSTFGPAWMMLSYGHSNFNLPPPEEWPKGGAVYTPHSEADHALIHQAGRAKEKWEAAARLSTEAELSAEIAFSLYSRESYAANLAASNAYFSEARQEELNKLRRLRNQYLRTLTEEYGDTRFLKKLQSQCSWVKLDAR